MSDLVSRLCDLHMQCDGLSLYAEAADRIEALERECDRNLDSINVGNNIINRLRAEREADEALMRQALEALENAIAIRNCEGGTKYGPDIEQPAIAALRERLGGKT